MSDQLNDEQILEKVAEIVVEQMDVKDASLVKLESNISTDLGADSLDAVELIMAVEEKFSVSIPDEDAEKLVTVGDVVKYVKNKL